jgi:hypothetical protein
LDLPFGMGSFAAEAVLAECSWRADPDGGVGARHVGGGLAIRGDAAAVVAVVVTVPFMAAGWQAVEEGD